MILLSIYNVIICNRQKNHNSHLTTAVKTKNAKTQQTKTTTSGFGRVV